MRLSQNDTERNETKQNDTERNETKQNDTERNERKLHGEDEAAPPILLKRLSIDSWILPSSQREDGRPPSRSPSFFPLRRNAERNRRRGRRKRSRQGQDRRKRTHR